MSDLFDWLGGLEPGPWSLLLVAVVGLALLAAWMSHMYCQYRKEVKRLEDRRLSQLQAWNQAPEDARRTVKRNPRCGPFKVP